MEDQKRQSKINMHAIKLLNKRVINYLKLKINQ